MREQTVSLTASSHPPGLFIHPGTFPLSVVFFGAPGAGKGTQADRFAQRYNVPKISTGDILRGAIHDGTELGTVVKETLHRGELVPDEIILEVVRARLEQPDTSGGFVLDGFPRTVPQARALSALVPSPVVVALDVAPETLVRRLVSRGRTDDNEQVIRERLKIYASQTRPVLDYYRHHGMIAVINGERPPDVVFAAVEAAIVRCSEPGETS